METEVQNGKPCVSILSYPDQPVMDEEFSQKPPGLSPFLAACRNFYPNQPHPFQFMPEIKFWQGGVCPLDYIYVYRNSGNADKDIAPHWHYIGFGLSNIYSEEKVNEISKGDTHSGYEIELTFRLQKESYDVKPPAWPVYMMQDVARIVFKERENFSPGDFLSYDISLGIYFSMHGLLFSEDPQLRTVETLCGPVKFLQLVGLYEKELNAAWPNKGQLLIDVMKTVKGAGGPWLVTNRRRGKTIFELNPSVQKTMNKCETFSDYVYRLIRWFLDLMID